MSESVGTIYYDVDANLEPLLGKMRQAESALGGLGTEMKNTDRSAAQMQKSFDKTERSAASLGGGLNSLTRAIKTVLAAMALRQMAGMVQEYQTMSERVKMATDSAEEYRLVQQRLQDTADGTYRSLSEAQELYIRTADSLKAMGYTTQELVDIQDSMSYAFVTNATSADRAQAAISQFTKSINTGKVSADQWETITSALPSVINDIADASGKSAGQVRALGAAGKLAARDLTEGLRASLEQNRSSAEGMATDLIDASVRIKNAITVTLVAMEDQTGALQGVTDGIIKASEALLAFGNDSDAIANLLDAAAIAGASLAAVIAGRIVTALGSSAVAMYQNTVGARTLAAAELEAAKRGAALAASQLTQAQAMVAAAGGKSMSAGASARLKVAEDAATAATARLTLAQTAMRGAFTVSAAAANGLRTAMAFLGGPAGVVMLAAVAIYSFASRARGATKPTDELTASIADLGNEMRKVRMIEIEKKIDELDKLAVQMQRNIAFTEEYDSARLSEKATQKMQEGLQREKAALEENRKEVDRLRAAIGELNAAQERYDFVGPPEPTAPKTGTDPGTGLADQLTEFKKLEQSYQNQIALAKKTGLARAELAALQRLGAEATTTERERITELVGQLYQLEEQTKANEKAEADRQKEAERAAEGQQANAESLADLREQLYQSTLQSDELIKRQAELSLNGYATPEQLEDVRELAAELHKLQLQAEAVAVDPRTDVSDNYARQLAALEEYKEAELITEQQYLELRNAAATEYEQQRLSAQEEIFRAQSESNELLMNSIDALGAASANVLAGMAEGAITGRDAVKMLSRAILDEAVSALVKMGLQQVKTMILGKAAQQTIAATSVATGAAVTAAWTPAAAAVSLATAGANSAPAIAGIAAAGSAAQALSAIGGRLAGGPVSAGRMYRVNENGAPEVFSAANGQQFMIPNQRGEVISNRNATAGGGGVVINIHNAPQGTVAESSQGQDGEQMIDIWVSDFLSDGRTSSAVQSKFGLSPQGR